MGILATINLNSGLPIHLSSVLILDAYAPMLEGAPSEATNTSMLRYHREMVQELWGAKPVYVAEPTTFLNASRQPELYPVLVAANLWSGTPMKHVHMHGSHLVVFQFQQRFSSETLARVLADLTGLEWHEHAADFWW